MFYIVLYMLVNIKIIGYTKLCQCFVSFNYYNWWFLLYLFTWVVVLFTLSAQRIMKWDFPFKGFLIFLTCPISVWCLKGKDLFENLLTSLNVTRNTETRNGIISTVICNTISHLLSDHSFCAVIIRKKQTNKEITEGSLNVGHEKRTTALSVIYRQLCMAGLVFFHGTNLKKNLLFDISLDLLNVYTL